ncbi:MAG: hypothetical protein K0R49_8 [Burkholderiales bacterium]|jgi:fucose 4-O-acetylase-like acetyltransferase|nr:hypothetical protein [Burkholderiales bacterium]
MTNLISQNINVNSTNDAGKQRSFRIDNARFLLACFVVIVHFLVGTGGILKVNGYENPVIETITISLNLFIMQGFVFISGIFSQQNLTSIYIQNTLRHIFYPYFILELLIFVFGGRFAIHSFLLEPAYAYWYLLSLLAWRFILPAAAQFKYALLLSIIAGIAVGLDARAGTYLSLSRTISFFPFFLLGNLYGKKLLTFDFKYAKVLSIILLVMAFLLVYFFYRRLNISPDYLLMKEPYYKFDTYVLKGAAIRLMIYAVSFVLMLSFFNLVPNRKTLISGLGARGMYVYMLHIFINGIMIKMNVYEHPTLLTQILLIPFAILCTVILASKYTEKIFKPIFFPEYVKKLFK